MTIRVKYWPKDKSFTVVENEHSMKDDEGILYDGRSEEFKQWLKRSGALFAWSQNSIAIINDKGKERSSVVYAIFENPRALGIIK
jgi:hypothetical protein